MVDRATITAARTDVAVFAEALVGEPLWPHQLELARSSARIRCMCSGRQAGKSRVLAVLALHEAFAGGDRRVLIISAGDDAAKRLLSECSTLATTPLLAGSVVDKTASLITLSNGSTVRSVPASERQVRGETIDLLVIDEACFVADDIWQAARFTIIARPGSRVVLASTPWGRRDRFFALAYRAGVNQADGYASFAWPSTVSPMVDTELLDMWRQTSTDREYRAEVLGEWVDDVGGYFSADEIDAALVDYDLVPPHAAAGREAVAGVDWGFARDANTMVLIARAGEDDPGFDRAGADGPVWFVPWLVERFDLPYSRFVAEVVAAGAPDGYRLVRVVAELNGVGAMPTQTLQTMMRHVEGVHTTAALKEAWFSALKMRLQQGRLVLPRHAALLRQLHALEYEQRDGGSLSIAVPERLGHDDLAMSLAMAASADAELGATGRRRGGLRCRGGEDPMDAAMRDFCGKPERPLVEPLRRAGGMRYRG